MKITLAQWKKIEAIVAKVKKDLHAASVEILQIAKDGGYKIGEPEYTMIYGFSWECEEAADALTPTASLHPQSEWMGGDSDDPKNHKLREPTICPLPHRKFTPEEIAEAGAVCHGPVQWEFKPPEPKT